MLSLKVSKEEEDFGDDAGILYVVHFDLEGIPLVKIGVTSRPIEERISEILVSIFKKYREFPYCRPKRFRKTDDAYKKEEILHKYFESARYNTQYKFSGSTEFFITSLDSVVDAYERLLNGEDLLNEGGQEQDSVS